MAHVSLLKHGIAGSRLSNLPGLKIQTWATPNGNVTGTANGNGNSYVYDSENHMISMSNSTTSVTMKYDAFGSRVSKAVTTTGGTVTTQYLVDDLNPTGYAQVLDELTGPIGSAAVSRTYTYGLQRISQVQITGNVLSYYQYDGGGSVRQLTNSSGVMTDSYEYDAFGNSFTKTGTTPNNYLYRGEQYDPDLGLYYLRARYYNPATGRFMSRDPLDGDATDPASLHKYLYAGGDPVNRVDPMGRVATIETIFTTTDISTPTEIGLRLLGSAINTCLENETVSTITLVAAALAFAEPTTTTLGIAITPISACLLEPVFFPKGGAGAGGGGGSGGGGDDPPYGPGTWGPTPPYGPN